jgi:hypothetical protein
MMQALSTIALLLAAQVLVWLQLNGQFIWSWFRDNSTLVSFIFAWPISWLFISYQKHAYVMFDQSLWSIRLFGYGIGMVIFMLMTWRLTGEVLNLKNAICLVLSLAIVVIQAFMK